MIRLRINQMSQVIRSILPFTSRGLRGSPGDATIGQRALEETRFFATAVINFLNNAFVTPILPAVPQLRCVSGLTRSRLPAIAHLEYRSGTIHLASAVSFFKFPIININPAQSDARRREEGSFWMCHRGDTIVASSSLRRKKREEPRDLPRSYGYLPRRGIRED